MAIPEYQDVSKLERFKNTRQPLTMDMRLLRRHAGGDDGGALHFQEFQLQDREGHESILEAVRRKRSLLENCFEDESFDIGC